MSRALGNLLAIVCALFALNACDPLTRHKVSSTIFDGVPSMPPADQFCQDFHEKKVLELAAAAAKVPTAAEELKKKEAASGHPPYKEKRCNDCHDKTQDSGLIKPKDQVCFVCHPGIMDKFYVHGPVAVGACLDCHDPHSSTEPALLKVEKKKLCVTCHKEKRVADAMHTKVTDSGMACTDCHNPHDGDAKYFLR